MPVLSWLLMHAYSSFAPQLLVLPMLLILLGHPGSAFALVLGYGMAGFGASVISVWFPALGAHVTYGIASQALSSVNVHFGYAFLNEFHAVRDQATFVLSVAKAQGILTFPSLHTAVAILCAAFAASHVWLRYPILVLNVLMVVSTLTHGGHYVIDVIAGMVLALLALLAVGAIRRSALVTRVSVAIPVPTFKAR
jgi:membrane-associated phospholipid phosphatase